MNMGEPFYGTGKPPEGYKPGDYVETRHQGPWVAMEYPSWHYHQQYRLPADHPFYLPPIWCLDKAAQMFGWNCWADAEGDCEIRVGNGLIAVARTLQHGCEPMQEPVDPLLLAMREAYASQFETRNLAGSAALARDGFYDARLTAILDSLRDGWDITPNGETK